LRASYFHTNPFGRTQPDWPGHTHKAKAQSNAQKQQSNQEFKVIKNLLCLLLLAFSICVSFGPELTAVTAYARSIDTDCGYAQLLRAAKQIFVYLI